MELEDFKPTQYVVTPGGRLAQVVGTVGNRLNLRYSDDGTEVLLLPELCRHADARLFTPDKA